MKKFTACKTFILDLLFPLHCISCKTVGVFLCGPCRLHIPESELACLVCGARNQNGSICISCKKDARGVDQAVWRASFENTILHESIHVFKYKGVQDAAPALASLIIPPLKKLLQGNTVSKNNLCIIPIPLYSKKLRLRGFNQSELLANYISEILSIPLLASGTLVRIKDTTPQVTMSRKERKHNIHKAFLVKRPELVSRKTIILIDDVLTTGSTVSEAAQALKQAGAQNVLVAVVARG